jgi:hypothetical protein
VLIRRGAMADGIDSGRCPSQHMLQAQYKTYFIKFCSTTTELIRSFLKAKRE